MKIQIDKTYAMPCAADVAWGFLQDLEGVAGCMPGAKITERLDAGRYKGTVTVKLGPATMAFRGEVELHDVDPGARSLRLLGKGTDSTGSSGATMNLTARIEADAAGQCNLVGAAEVSMSGKAVAFGGRMMNAVAEQLLKQFANNFAARVGALQAQPETSGDRAPPGAATAAGAADAARGSVAATAASAAPAASELNGLALMWTLFKEWLRGLLSKKSA